MTSATKPLTSQVGGHAGVLATEDGSLIIKPALPLELKFYQALQQNTELQPLLPFIPQFLGTLRLEGKMDEAKSAEEENLSHAFLKPNIIDIKLGTVLYDEAALPDKVERMIQAAKDTTSFETGVRLTGFQVYDNITSEAVHTPKSYGRSIKPADLPDGIARFFPVGAQEGGETLAGASTSGLPLHTLLPVLHSIREDIAEIRDVYSKLEIRMVGGSLLITYEADWARAEVGVKWLAADEEEEDDDDDDDDDDEEGKNRPGPPYLVKLIDFAHTRLTPGMGADEGVLLGMDTVLKLIDGRIAQLEQEK